MTQLEFAKTLGISRGMIQRVELGENEPSPKIITKFDDLLNKSGLTYDTLMSGPAEPPPSLESRIVTLEALVQSQQETIITQARAIEQLVAGSVNASQKIGTVAPVVHNNRIERAVK
jgi:transcriptional regulator with XRE-family HTH domain